MSKRSFEEAVIIATGVQTPSARFRQHDRDPPERPSVAQWRCNLTALSAHHNLYFVAYNTSIHVYLPQFPSQALPTSPALIIPSRPSRPGLQGYLDPRNPHAINHLVAHFLGTEEIVAAVRDDGDVDAFLVRHILHAIDRRTAPANSIGPTADELRPFFQSNVGLSAWGLAVHAAARIIAVSSNTHNITIFKFGLVDHVEGESSEDLADEKEHATSASATVTHSQPPAREMDVTLQVINGSSNIPCISFCNTGDDPTATWLLTTDISGFCRAINLHTMQSAQTFRFGPPTSGVASHDRFNSGWTIMFLDRRSFMPEDNVHAALGLEERDSLPGIQNNRSVWDIGATVSHIPDCANKFTARRRPRPRRPDMVDRRSTSIASPSDASESDPQSVGTSSNEQDENATRRGYEHVWGDESPADTSQSEDDWDSGHDLYDAELDFDDEGTEDSTPFSARYGGRRIYGNEPRAFKKDAPICGDLPCPILHASVRNVYLIQPGDQRGPFPPPTVGFTNALHQLVQGEYAWLNVYERLNMSCYIPAIGIVVLASQKGRVMVLSLTAISPSVPMPPEMRDPREAAAAASSSSSAAADASSTPTAGSRPTTKYAMRIERILPFAQQERARQRPFAPLLGIAAGPIQGTAHLPDARKRWRVLLMYADHSVFSYEIRRRRARDSGVGVGEVVV